MTNPSDKPDSSSVPVDARLYVPASGNWQVRVKTDWSKSYCFSKQPGEDFYHLIVNGEVFLQSGDETYCLSCALRLGIATRDRLFWQKREIATSIEPTPGDEGEIPGLE